MPARRPVRLMRMQLDTDTTPEDPDYWGAFSDPFMVADNSEIVAVDWSVPGKVTVTMLVPVLGSLR